jgi:hypothetical protein
MRPIIASILALLLAVPFAAHAAPTVTLSGNPTSGISPVAVTLTWVSTESSACAASGGWSGVKATSGTEVIADLRADTQFTLVCSASTGSAVASWTIPTTNTDGSAIPATGRGSLAGFEIYQAATAAGLATATPVNIPNKSATSHTVTSLPVGPRFYAVKAYNTEGVRSDLSNVATNTIVLPSATATASVTVNVKPEAPIVTVAQTVRLLINDKPSLVAGKVKLGVACGAVVDGEWAQVDRGSVKLNFFGKVFRNASVVAKCA